MGCIGKIFAALLGLIGIVLAAAIGFLLWYNIPSNASGMAAKSVCSAAFVAGRSGSPDLMAEDVLPASGVLKAISTKVDTNQKSVTSKFLGLFPRTAALVKDRGCVLDAAPDAGASAYTPIDSTQPWPAGDKPNGEGDASELNAIGDKVFQGAGDPTKANARGFAVIQDGKLLIRRDAPGFAPGTALHGWSMTKTVAAMLAYAKAKEVGLDLEKPVVDAFPTGREPSWVANWRKDDRAKIKVSDLVFMRDGLKLEESYDPWGDVVQMLYGEKDMPAWAADHPAEVPPATRWRYLSATSNLFAAVTRAQFASDQEFWTYPKKTLFDPLGMKTATLETDTDGTWVGSSYLWASVGDWARLGQLMLQDGQWEGKQVLPPGFLALASTPAMPSGEGKGYGAQAWRPGDRESGDCKAYPGVPEDTVSMEGHWGQIVAMVPSRKAVIVRLGWTFDSSQFDSCQLISDVVGALPA